VIHSDSSPHFDNEEVIEWASKWGIKWVFGGPGTTKTQGKAERAIRSAKVPFWKLLIDKPKHWRELVPQVQMSFNTKYMYQDDKSPAMLFMGYQPRYPIENLLDPPAANLEIIDSKIVEQLSRLRLARLDAWRLEHVQKQLYRWSQRIDSLEKSLGINFRYRYHVGDFVLYQNYSLVGKSGSPWDQRWRGPVKIIYISRKAKIDLQHPSGDIMKGWHSDRLRPYYLRE
jgi:transposase InsO family protein